MRHPVEKNIKMRYVIQDMYLIIINTSEFAHIKRAKTYQLHIHPNGLRMYLSQLNLEH